MAKSYAVLIDILKRLPDTPNATILQLEKDGGDFPGSERGEELIKKEIMPILERMMQDEDVDVRFFATTAARRWTEGAMEV